MNDSHDYDRFQHFIEDMGDMEFESWYDNASYEQRVFADTIRHELDEEEEQDMEDLLG